MLKLSEDIYKKTYNVLLIAIAFLIPILSFQYGTSWDERMSIKYSDDVLKYFFSFGQERRCLDEGIQVYNHLIYYGNIFGLTSALLAKILPFNIVEIRHVLCSFFGFLTILYTSKVAKLFGGHKLAILSILLLLLNPRLFGHMMNAFRDVSFMLGYIASLYYILRFYKNLPEFDWKISLKLALSIFFATSVRIGGLLCIIMLFISAVIYLSVNRKTISDVFLKKLSIHLLSIVAFSYVLIVAIWPWAHQRPLLAPILALLEFSDLQLIVSYQLFDGEMIANRNVPWMYLFVWIAITLPLLVLSGIVFYLIGIKSICNDQTVLNVLLLIAIGLPLIGYFVSNRNLYDSWRHFMFLTPILTLIASLGWRSLYRMINIDQGKKIVILGFLVLSALPLWSHIVYFPHQTLYFNEIIGGLKGAFGKYEVDIDANSMRSLTEKFNEIQLNTQNEQSLLATNCDPLSVSHYLDNKQMAKNIRWIGQGQLYLIDWEYALYSCRTNSKDQLKSNYWPLKEAIYTLEVDGVPIASILKRNERNGLIGFNLMNKGEVRDALPYLQQAVNYNPDNDTYQRILGINLFKMGDVQGAKKHLNKSININSDNTFTLYYLAEVAFYENDYPKALKFLQMAKEKRLNNYVAYCLEATIYYLQNDMPRAKMIFENLLNDDRINKKDLSVISNAYGKIYLNEFFNSEGKCQECAKNANHYFEKAVNYDLQNPEPYLNSIELFRQLGSEKDVKQVQELMRKYVK